jgi:hypothetical protein
VYLWETECQESTLFSCTGWWAKLWHDMWRVDALWISSMSRQLVRSLENIPDLVIDIHLIVSSVLNSVESLGKHVDMLVNLNGIAVFDYVNSSHSPSACNESIPCQTRITVRCECGLHKQEITCLATSSEQSRGLKSLACTDLCARTDRNRKLAEALDIDTTASFQEPENVKGGYQLTTLDYFVNNKTWCLEIEVMFREFLAGPKMRLAFKPMNGHKREFVHELAEAYALNSDSIDYEPYRRYSLSVLC